MQRNTALRPRQTHSQTGSGEMLSPASHRGSQCGEQRSQAWRRIHCASAVLRRPCEGTTINRWATLPIARLAPELRGVLGIYSLADSTVTRYVPLPVSSDEYARYREAWRTWLPVVIGPGSRLPPHATIEQLKETAVPRTLGLVASAKSLPTEGKRLFAAGWSPRPTRSLDQASARAIPRFTSRRGQRSPRSPGKSAPHAHQRDWCLSIGKPPDRVVALPPNHDEKLQPLAGADGRWMSGDDGAHRGRNILSLREATRCRSGEEDS